jgi:hypothetical protein
MDELHHNNKLRTDWRFFGIITVAFVAVLMLSNTLAVKVLQIGPLYMDGGTILFPISYIFGDVLTEVYGFRLSRRVIWTGFAAIIGMAAAYAVVGWLPASSDWGMQGAYASILGQVPRIVLASLCGYFCGEFVNSTILSRMKVWTNGRALWSRTIGSTVVGELIDSVVFVFIAFTGVIPLRAVIIMAASNWAFKTAYEVACTPVTYKVVNYLKRAERVDVVDDGVWYNPFSVSIDGDDESNRYEGGR